ncbi:MAG: FixH family protein [Lunatimonas sp.]|uniref:FixH family protein n=1 Tax=Lunatimonas sp. TaxID=2060141 RepID=UPI00263BD210|nr:FixH family protein [Lunatimonas sp.]MCC5939392.1 FixH family protein [Lunatimonas sp.]
MDWGKGIVLTFVVFAGIIISMVTICMKQDDLHLVTQNYYEEEIRYQEHIDKMDNATALGLDAFTFDGKTKAVDLHLPVGSKGELHLFRPSDARLDQKLALDIVDEQSLFVDLKDLKPGYWRIKLTWSADGKSYFQEEKVTL